MFETRALFDLAHILIGVAVGILIGSSVGLHWLACPVGAVSFVVFIAAAIRAHSNDSN